MAAPDLRSLAALPKCGNFRKQQLTRKEPKFSLLPAEISGTLRIKSRRKRIDLASLAASHFTGPAISSPKRAIKN